MPRGVAACHYITRTYGIASPAFGGLNDRKSMSGSMTFSMNNLVEKKQGVASSSCKKTLNLFIRNN
jgi:hypothetical protein